MLINEQIQELIKAVPFVPVTTVSAAGKPHTIVVGQVKEVLGDDKLSLGIYKMQTTQQNVKETGLMQVILASMEGGPKGYRLEGKACIEGSTIVFKAEKADPLL
ncbi:pyridoxamine 5'-phosphate oxidase family protein [Candidatus Formimonas warabiya]|uniref:Pyridoxamine 5-phosphate oxidase n=1 Tax=Formimonas warabiya TaxID=1761012 RepID=A0A3G1KZ30_FORW1|nr:pyridoxamine 5'-phosphate oxidase family protein [Candidatus Formimonas warabiya]ATW27738.1 pyridoxamine 5-phosphate oxidase [Candidatus Formimonas warabiya]